ncbi:MAG: glycoside hydrolase family 5 protein [Lactobacillales bacterium]|nr:glycoside hydrolase family 5 protein [Lactobacillales bacterium]
MKKVIVVIILCILSFIGLYFNSGNQLDIVKEVKTEEKETQEEINNKVEKHEEKNNLASYNGKLKIKNTDLVNQYEEKFQLRGISTHGIQWYSKYANEEIIKQLRDEWNANVIRIAMYTEENGYIQNKSLKNKVDEIVGIAIKLDMYVIIDWHILSDNNPNIHKEEAKKFFDEMSNKYKNVPNVIFEICNEPNGNINWNNDIKPYAEEIIKIIRNNSKDSIVIVGTGTWSQDVHDAANNPLKYENIMYACHFYSGTHKSWLRDRIDYARSKGIAIIISEFGVSNADGTGGVFKEETLKWLEYLNNKNISWINWSLSDKNETSALLIPGTPTNNISDKYLSESGKIIKEQMKK